MTADLDLEILKLRTLMLVNEVGALPGNAGKLDGLTKLAKLDFLCRYWDSVEMVAAELGVSATDGAIDRHRPQSVPMTRYKFGPWDDRYYEVIGALVGRGLMAYRAGRRGSVALATTATGRRVCDQLASEPLWAPIRRQCKAVADLFGMFNGNQLREAIYTALPEAMDVPHRSLLQ